jgi:O-antigen/teichoic acid export membrane protein
MLINQGIWAVATQALIILSGLMSTIVLNRVLGPQGRGEVSLAMLWPVLLSNLGIAGWIPAISANMARGAGQGRGLWLSAQLAALAVSALASAIGWVLLPHLLEHTPQIIPLARFFLLCIPASIACVISTTVLEALGLFDQTIGIRLGHVASTLLATLLLLMAGRLSAKTYLGASVLTAYMINMYAAWRVVKRVGGNWRLSLKGMPVYVLRAAPLSWAQIAQQRVDQILISIMVAPDTAGFGIYVTASAIGGMLAALASALSFVVMPECARRSNHDALRLFSRVSRVFIAVYSICAIPIVLLARGLLSLAYGPSFAAGANTLRLTLATTLLAGILNLAICSLQGMHRPGHATFIGVASCIVGTTAAAILLPQIGYLGAPAGQGLGLAFGLLLLGIVLRRDGFNLGSLLPMPDDFRFLWLSIRDRLGSKRAFGAKVQTSSGAEV